MKWIAFLSLPLYALDQISKYWILRHVDAESQISIIPRWFYLVNVPNTGAAFGSFKNNNVFFIVLSCIALVAVVPLLLRNQDSKDAWRDLSLALLLAGGCVRDMVRKLPPKDIDIATDARPEEVQKLFPRTYAVGAHFGVIVVLENGFQFEVATFRSDDVYLDGRRPSEVRFSSPAED